MMMIIVDYYHLLNPTSQQVVLFQQVIRMLFSLIFHQLAFNNKSWKLESAGTNIRC